MNLTILIQNYFPSVIISAQPFGYSAFSEFCISVVFLLYCIPMFKSLAIFLCFGDLFQASNTNIVFSYTFHIIIAEFIPPSVSQFQKWTHQSSFVLCLRSHVSYFLGQEKVISELSFCKCEENILDVQILPDYLSLLYF